jgi:predicted HTH domain antitoxin
MQNLIVPVPEETLLALKIEPDAMAEELRFAAAVKLYEIGRLSSGSAANLAGVPKPVFLSRLAEYGVATFQLNEEELVHDAGDA